MTDTADRDGKSGSWDLEVVTGASLVAGAGETQQRRSGAAEGLWLHGGDVHAVAWSEQVKQTYTRRPSEYPRCAADVP